MSLTLRDLRGLLDLALEAGGPAIDRLDRHEVAALAEAYLPRWASRLSAPDLDLTDPGVVQVYLVALALSYGMDPGPMGLGVRLRQYPPSQRGWIHGGGWMLIADCGSPRKAGVESVHYTMQADALVGATRWVCAPEVAAVPWDRPDLAIVAMVRRRLEGGDQ